jgi:AcrR family transcriptional regulator
MAVANETPRKYRSPLRQEQALRTRAAVLDAAGRLFVAKGFVATTMKDIAAEAAVSVESVYAQGSKSALLLACVDRSIVGHDAAEPLLERADMRTMLTSPDVKEKLAILRAIVLERVPTSAPIFEAFRGAAAADPALAAEWKTYDQRRYADCTRMVDAFTGHLRTGLTADAATDIFYALVSPAMVQMFVQERGWTAEAFADWLVDSIGRLLLSQDPLRSGA